MEQKDYIEKWLIDFNIVIDDFELDDLIYESVDSICIIINKTINYIVVYL